MFEYFKLKAELKACKEASVALVDENRELRSSIQTLRKYEAQRNTDSAKHRQRMIEKLENQFLSTPSQILLDAIKYYKDGPVNPYTSVTYIPSYNPSQNVMPF